MLSIVLAALRRAVAPEEQRRSGRRLTYRDAGEKNGAVKFIRFFFTPLRRAAVLDWPAFYLSPLNRDIEETDAAADEVDAKEAVLCSSNAGKSGFGAAMEMSGSTPVSPSWATALNRRL